jgi:hypothetical protein
MKALKAERLLDSGNKDDRVLAPTTGLVCYLANAFRRLKTPGVSLLSSQVASKQTLERFEQMLQCGF